MARRDLTQKQEAVLDFIVLYFKETLTQASYREIAEQFNFKSTNAVSDHMKSLQRKGWLLMGGEAKTKSTRFTPKTKMRYGLFWKEKK